MGHFRHISFAALSDIGRKRKNNEDSFGAFPEAGVFCVADGMGGGDDGEVASSATVHAVESFAKALSYPPKLAYPVDSLISGLRAAVNSASSWIFCRAQEKKLKGCGSTFVGVCLDAACPDKAVALHAGDSRLYRIRGRSIQQITKDHSAAELIGAKDENDINPMFRGMILRAVGIQKTVEIDATAFGIKQGDRILICSDGLSKMLADKRIVSISKDSPTVDEAAKNLVAAANDAGGFDNVTVVLLDVGKLPNGLPVVDMPAGIETRIDAGAEYADGHTQDTNADTGVSFDLGVASATNTSGGGGETQSMTCSTMTIPEDDAAEHPEDGADELHEVSAGPETPESPNAKKQAGFRFLALVCAGIAVVLLLAAVVFFSGGDKDGDADSGNRDSSTGKIEVSGAIENADGDSAVNAQAEAEHKRFEEEERARQLKAEEEIRRREEEKARRVAEEEARRVAEEKARRAAEEEARRVAEEDAKRREEEEAKRRAEEARRMEESFRKRAEEAKLKAMQEKERKRKEELERIEKERELAKRLEKEKAAAREAMRREAAYAALKRVSVDESAASFVRKVKTLVQDELTDAICPVFRPMLGATTKKESEAAAIALAKNMQPIIAKLAEYAALYRADAEAELNDPATTSVQRRRQLEEVPGKMKLFMENAGHIVGRDVKDPDVHMACALMIEMVPLWF